jgi:hypothetical protein
MAQLGRDSLRRSPVVHALIGVAIAVVLELLLLHMAGHTCSLLEDAIRQAVQAAGRTLTHAEMAGAKEPLRGCLLAESAAHWLAFVLECGLAFWVGRKAAPRWGWGILVAAPRLFLGVAAAVSMLRWGTTWVAYVTRSSLWELVRAAPMGVAAWTGSLLPLHRKVHGVCDVEDDTNLNG